MNSLFKEKERFDGVDFQESSASVFFYNGNYVVVKEYLQVLKRRYIVRPINMLRTITPVANEDDPDQVATYNQDLEEQIGFIQLTATNFPITDKLNDYLTTEDPRASMILYVAKKLSNTRYRTFEVYSAPGTPVTYLPRWYTSWNMMIKSSMGEVVYILEDAISLEMLPSIFDDRGEDFAIFTSELTSSRISQLSTITFEPDDFNGVYAVMVAANNPGDWLDNTQVTPGQLVPQIKFDPNVGAVLLMKPATPVNN